MPLVDGAVSDGPGNHVVDGVFFRGNMRCVDGKGRGITVLRYMGGEREKESLMSSWCGGGMSIHRYTSTLPRYGVHVHKS